MTFVPDMSTIAPDMSTSWRDDDIAAALFGVVRRRVLALLFGHTDQSYYTRQITRAVDAGHGAVQRELKHLAASGLVTRTRTGNQVFYQANEKSPVFAELRGLIAKTVGLADPLREALVELASRIEVAFVYGSITDGTDGAGSDVDLMIIGDVGLRDLSPRLREVQGQLGRDINPVTMSPSELRDSVGKADRFLETVFHSPKIFLIGGQDDLARIAGQPQTDR